MEVVYLTLKNKPERCALDVSKTTFGTKNAARIYCKTRLDWAGAGWDAKAEIPGSDFMMEARTLWGPSG